MSKKISKQILSKFKTLETIDLSWCDSLVIENNTFNKITISGEVNEFNYLTHVNIYFHAENPPGFIYTGIVKVTDFKTKEELENLINKQIRLANVSITDAIFRANQYKLFD